MIWICFCFLRCAACCFGLEDMLAVIHQLAYRRLPLWCDLGEVHGRFRGDLERFFDGNNTDLLPICADQTYFPHVIDFVVQPDTLARTLAVVFLITRYSALVT